MNQMNLENIKVREVSGPEKGKAEIEQELLDTHKLKEEQGETAEVVVEKKEEPKLELTDESVLKYLGKRYNKEINSFDELVQERETQPDLPEDVSAFLKYKKDTGR